MIGNKIAIRRQGQQFQDFTKYSDIESFNISYGLNTSDQSYSFTSAENINFTGEAFDFLREVFFSDCSGIEQVLDVEIYAAQCDSHFRLSIAFDDVEICYSAEDCDSISVSVTKLDNKCYKYLDETPFLEGFSELEHPILWYSIAGGTTRVILWILSPILYILLFSLTITINFLIGICKVLEPIIDLTLGVVNVLNSASDAIFGGESTKDEVIDQIEQIYGVTFTAAERQGLKGQNCENILASYGINNDDANTAGLEVILGDDPTGWCLLIALAEDSNSPLNFDCPDFISFDSLVCGLYRYISGNGYKSRVAVVREIFEYHMSICGGKFESSILQDTAYKGLALFSGQNGTGSRNIDEYIPRERWITDTGIQLLKKLETVFHAEFWFEGNTLRFERVGYRESLLPEFPLTLDQIIDLKQSDVCIGFNIEDKFAYGRFEYTDDGIERQGNRAAVSRDYDTIVEWNEENADWKSKEGSTIVPFGRARFMYDSETRADNGFGLALDMDNYRAGKGSIILNPLRYLTNQAITQNGLDAEITKADGLCSSEWRQCDMLLHDDMTSLPKLVVLAPQSPTNDWYKDAKVMHTPILNADGTDTGFKNTNSLMYFDEEAQFPELYKFSHYTKDPNYLGRDIYEISGIELGVDCSEIDCDIVKFVQDNPNGYKIKSEGRYLPIGYAVPENTTIDYTDSSDITKINIGTLKYNCQ